MSARAITRVEGRAVPLRGDSIDTDRIIPARFLRAVTFEGLESHLFEDDRAQRPSHPFSSPAYRGATLLLVNANFGCGSSREHAPQAIQRWGIRAVVGQSFSEIFFGNAMALGLPCVTAGPDAIAALMRAVEASPGLVLRLDLTELTVETADGRWPVKTPAAAREALVTGAWDATGLLLDRYDEVEAVRARLPYIRGFQSS
jgi:3-isopropylmalate/(R)-2-methylmalate dehydratase small subunit